MRNEYRIESLCASAYNCASSALLSTFSIFCCSCELVKKLRGSESWDGARLSEYFYTARLTRSLFIAVISAIINVILIAIVSLSLTSYHVISSLHGGLQGHLQSYILWNVCQMSVLGRPERRRARLIIVILVVGRWGIKARLRCYHWLGMWVVWHTTHLSLELLFSWRNCPLGSSTVTAYLCWLGLEISWGYRSNGLRVNSTYSCAARGRRTSFLSIDDIGISILLCSRSGLITRLC